MARTRGGGVFHGRGRSRSGAARSEGSVHHSDPRDPPYHPPDIREIVRQEMAGVIREVLPDIVREVVGTQQTQPNVGVGNTGGHGGTGGTVVPKPSGCTFKDFLDCKPLEFHGGGDPTEAMNWLTYTEEMFETCNVGNGNKVDYAAKLLKKAAYQWWEGVKGTLGRDIVRLLTWDQFRVKFEEEYCSGNTIRALEEEFLHFEQGTMSVQDYTLEFNKNARFAQHQVNTERRKIDRYAWGLKTEIREFVKPSDYTTCHSIVDAAKEMEGS